MNALPVADLPPPTRAQALTGALWAAAGALARYAIAGVTTLALTRLLAPEAFGLVAITYAAQELIAHVAPIGFHDALIQRPRLDPAALDAAFWSIAGVAGVCLVLCILLASPIASWFDEPQLAPLWIAASAAAFARAAGMVPRAVLARRLDFRTPTLVRLAGMALGGAVAIGLAAAGAGPWSLIAQVALLNLTGTLLVVRATRWRPGVALNRAALRGLWAFAPSVSAFVLLAYVQANADDQLIGYRLGAESLGYYALAYSFMAWPVRDVLGGVSVVFYPVLARLQAEPDRLRNTFLEGVQLTTTFAFPALTLIAITAPALVPWLLGARWAPIVLTVQVLALGGLRDATMMLNGAAYRAVGQPQRHLMLAAAGAACYVVGFLVGLRTGIAGVALFYALTGALLHPAAWWLLSRTIGLSLRRWLAALTPPAIATACMAAVALPAFALARRPWALPDAAALALTVSVAAIVYGGVLLAWRPAALGRTVTAAWALVRQRFAN